MKKAFTLIELLVVVGIVVLLTAVSISAFVSARKNRNLKAEADKISTIIQNAHALAVSPPSDSFGLEKIRVEVDKTNKVVNLYKVVGGAQQPLSVNINGGFKTTTVTFDNLDNSCSTQVKCHFDFLANNPTKIGQVDSEMLKTPANPVKFCLQDAGQNFCLNINSLTGNVGLTNL